MKKWLIGALALWSIWGGGALQARPLPRSVEYMIVVSRRASNDASWRAVIEALERKHKGSEVLYYKDSPREVMTQLRMYTPRYVAVVDKPEAIGRDFVVDLNRMSREIDLDIYADFLWGIITGYDADAAMRMVTDTKEPLVIGSALSTVSSFGEGRWFDRFAFISDAKPGEVGERESRQAGLRLDQVTDSADNRLFRDMAARAQAEGRALPPDFSVRKLNLLQRFCDYYAKYDPDLIVTASHATERNLEMPFSSGNLMCRDGKLYADFPDGPRDLTESGKRRVYLPIGNCLMGNLDRTAGSMAAAFMNSANVRTLVGYVVDTWYGRNGWGGLCYLMNNPGRYTVAESFYLNRQDLIFKLREQAPDLVNKTYPYVEAAPGADHVSEEYKAISTKVGRELGQDEFGLFYDRDVVAYYGDPLWDVRLATPKDANDYEVSTKLRNGKCIVTVKTGPDFSLERMEGADFRSQHVGKLPFSYFFPRRLFNPRLAEGQEWKAAVDENFILVYSPGFEPNKTYTIELVVDR